jgi:hypothetical protein
MTGTSSDMKLLLDTITRRQWQEHHGVQKQFHVRWCSCHCQRVMVSNNSFMSDDVPVIVYVQWCPTTVSCQMMFLSLSTCNGVQQQFHIRWCSCHCLRVMVSNNSFMSDDVPVIIYVQWCPDMKLLLDTIARRQWQEHHLTWNYCWTPLDVDNDRNIIWHEIVFGHHYT